jgi:hypothetical protein
MLKVYNINAITLPFNISYTNYYDHSKFVVATVPAPWQPIPWVCIGDINRQVATKEEDQLCL